VLTSEIDVATALQSITSVILTHYQPVKTLTRPVQDPGFNPALLQWQQRHQRQQQKKAIRIRHPSNHHDPSIRDAWDALTV